MLISWLASSECLLVNRLYPLPQVYHGLPANRVVTAYI
jgi:hypothetical protein